MSLILYLEQREHFVSTVSCKLTLEMIEHIKPQIIISYNYRYMIGREIIDFVNGEVFNLHISLLPWNRGSNPNYWSFIENTPKGVTIHQVDEGLDTGDIVIQEELFFDENKESFVSSYEKLNNRIVELFIQNWESLRDGTYKLQKQEGEGSYHTKKDLQLFLKGMEMNWGKNIMKYKAELEGGKG